MLAASLTTQAASAGTAATAVAKDPRLGQAAPDFELPVPDPSQPPLRLSALRGKWVLLSFWASWCPACQQALAWLPEAQTRYGARGLQLIAVGEDSLRADADAFLQQHPVPFPVGFDPVGKLARTAEVKAMPAFLLIAPDGTLRAVHEGWSGKTSPTALDRLLRTSLPAR